MREPRRPDIADIIRSLVTKSLVIATPAGSDMRFGLLDTIRLFARDRLAATGDQDRTSQRHASWIHESLMTLDPEERQYGRTAQVIWHPEMANIRQAIEFLLRSGQYTDAGDIVIGLAVLWRAGGNRPRSVGG